jgi:hypothetical protein
MSTTLMHQYYYSRKSRDKIVSQLQHSIEAGWDRDEDTG